MANPQPDEFTRISNELYTAIMQADFTKRQRNIIDLVIRMSYGCGKKSAILRPVDFELVGVYKTHVRKELDYLVKAKVLIIDGNRISINKDYDQWRISLVKGADKKRFDEVLRRNIEDREKVTVLVTEEGEDSYQNGNHQVNQVTKMVTSRDEKVTEMVTEVTKTVTCPENGGYQNSNQQVTKTVTERATEALSPNGYREPKENIKENTGVCILPLPPKKKNEPQNIEDILSRYQRYTDEQLAIIRNYWETIRFTRKTAKIAPTVVAKEMDYWERFPVEIVMEALDIHLRKYQSKQEDYTAGIMRRLLKERELKGKLEEKGVKLNGQGRQPPDAREAINLDKFLWKGS
ncbi:replication protein [Carboxydothermus hydrogenoformans]|uniref:Putative prophage LambdaCh01, replication protein O n=1 Tax=Carboxydothermus hydrogenoformans (strain ATCC BAA-161 / DSM 6008 / Z-2901) TaxID=246194 RepID=Q3ABH7_CARHZ|nr:replication protein [Carboxydothermus hydrogenoformans]ABB13994.1 putative prophage LambdaCh01, replication protein O [Carboxydothermus hydrogenoformans Z-2901]